MTDTRTRMLDIASTYDFDSLNAILIIGSDSTCAERQAPMLLVHMASNHLIHHHDAFLIRRFETAVYLIPHCLIHRTRSSSDPSGHLPNGSILEYWDAVCARLLISLCPF